MPVRGRKRSQGRWESAGVAEAMDRTTVSRDWHKQALQDAALRDMPLHALRHTAAASWLAAGNSLMYVQRQLGHADIGTTERYYGHLERHVLAAGAIATEEAIARAAVKPTLDQRLLSTDGHDRRPLPVLAGAGRRDRPGRQVSRASASHCSRSEAMNRSGLSSPPSRTEGCGPFAPPRIPTRGHGEQARHVVGTQQGGVVFERRLAGGHTHPPGDPSSLASPYSSRSGTDTWNAPIG